MHCHIYHIFFSPDVLIYNIVNMTILNDSYFTHICFIMFSPLSSFLLTSFAYNLIFYSIDFRYYSFLGFNSDSSIKFYYKLWIFNYFDRFEKYSYYFLSKLIGDDWIGFVFLCYSPLQS